MSGISKTNGITNRSTISYTLRSDLMVGYLDALKDLEERAVQLVLKYDGYSVNVKDHYYRIVDNKGYACGHSKRDEPAMLTC